MSENVKKQVGNCSLKFKVNIFKYETNLNSEINEWKRTSSFANFYFQKLYALVLVKYVNEEIKNVE